MLIHCLWEWKMVQPLWKSLASSSEVKHVPNAATIWSSQGKEGIRPNKDLNMNIYNSFVTAPNWKQLKCSWSDECTNCGISMLKGFPGRLILKESACNAGDTGSFPESGRSHKGAWWATVHGVARVGHDWATKATTATYDKRLRSNKNKRIIDTCENMDGSQNPSVEWKKLNKRYIWFLYVKLLKMQTDL